MTHWDADEDGKALAGGVVLTKSQATNNNMKILKSRLEKTRRKGFSFFIVSSECLHSIVHAAWPDQADKILVQTKTTQFVTHLTLFYHYFFSVQTYVRVHHMCVPDISTWIILLCSFIQFYFSNFIPRQIDVEKRRGENKCGLNL